MTLFHTVEVNDAIDVRPPAYGADAVDLKVRDLDDPIPVDRDAAAVMIEALQEALA